MQSVQIAIRRFGLGRLTENGLPADSKRWLLEQFDSFEPSPPAFASMPNVSQQIRQIADMGLDQLQSRAVQERLESLMPENKYERRAPEAMLFRPARASYIEDVSAKFNLAAQSRQPFVERLVSFWSNHFAISIDKPVTLGLAGAFEREAIRPHVLGNFSDLLAAVERHPGMLLFLDQAQSVGPNSPLAKLGQRRRRQQGTPPAGINENLAREILELHTLGVNGGYEQEDVTELARAMTGWTMSGLGRLGRAIIQNGNPGYLFFPAMHEPGTRSVLGKNYAQEGENQAQAILDDLAIHPATARHLATKLAQHFVSDNPPSSLVSRLEVAFLESGGDLPTVYRALIEAPEAWNETPQKFLQPWEWMMAIMRGFRVPVEGLRLVGILRELGQPIWRPGSPAGWDDTAASWAAPDAVMRRVELSGRIGELAESADARRLAAVLFGDSLSDNTRLSIEQAESPAQAIALLLVAPEMLRR